MEDPCVRKATKPLPVSSQSKRKREDQGDDSCVKFKKQKSLFDELELSDAEEVQASVCSLVQIMENETPIENKKFKSKEFVSSSEDEDDLVEVFVETHEETDVRELEIQGSKNYSSQEIDNAEKKININTTQAGNQTNTNKKPITKQESNKPNNKHSGETQSAKKIILIPPKDNRCKYIFVKKPKRGERCPNLTQTTYCMMHTKAKEKTTSNAVKNVHNMRELQLNTNELSSKVDHLINEIKIKKN